MLNCAYSGRKNLPARHLLRLDETFWRSELPMRGRNGAMAGSPDRSPRNSTGCWHVCFVTTRPTTEQPKRPLPRTGTILVREWRGTTHHVTVVDDGFLWNGKTHRSLSSIARAITGTNWNGPRFFGMREAKEPTRRRAVAANERKLLRCAIYTRKSSEHGLEQTSTRLTPSARRLRPISRARPMRAGG